MSTGRPLRLAFCEDRFHSFYGAQQNLYNLARALPPDVQPVMVTTAEGEFARRCRAGGLPVAILPIGDVARAFGGRVLRYGTRERLRLLRALAGYNLRFRRWLRAHGIDAVVCDGVRFPLQVAAAVRAARVPLLTFLQCEIGLGWLADTLYNVSDRMMVITSALCREFGAEVRAFAPDKLVTLNTGFDFAPLPEARARGRALRRAWGVPEDAVVIGLVGSITARKGADVLVRAAPRVLAAIPDARFVLVGSVPAGHEGFARALEADARAAGLDGRFHTTGFLDDVAAAYGALDLVTLPSRSEGLPGVVIEALAYGLPCVATTVGGTADLLREPGLGRMVAPDDPEALAAALVAAHAAERAAGPAQAASRAAWARAAFSTEGYVRRFLAILAGLGLRAAEPASGAPSGARR